MKLSDGDSRTLQTLCLSVVLSAQIFILVPITIYTGNLPEFVTPIGPILKLLAIPTLSLVLLIVIGGKIAGAGRHGRYAAIIATLALLTWLQGYVMVWDYGLLDGTNIDWDAAPWRGRVDLGIWIAAALCGWFFNRRLQRFLVTSVMALFVAQCALLGGTIMRNVEDLHVKSLRQVSADALVEMYKFSPDRNVVQIVLDSFQTDIFREIISSGVDGTRFQSWLEGFVFYEENVGAFPYTHFALPAMLSGEVYRNDMPKNEFIKSTFGGKTILNAAYDAGYQIDVASESFMINMLTQGHYTNSYLVSENVHLSGMLQAQNEAAKLVDLALFRLLPHYLKRHVYNDQLWLVQNLLGRGEHLRFAYFRSNALLLGISQNLSTERTTPVYKFFHLMNTHAPMVVNPDCSYAGTLPRIRATVIAQSQCSLRFVVALLNSMKEAGIYNDALIMIMADHGGHIPPDRYVPETVTDGQEKYVVNPWTVAMATPLMLVKAPGASGPLRISSAATSLLDIPATVSSVLHLEGGFKGHSVLENPSLEGRERRFYYYPWRNGDNAMDYILPIQEFIISGSIYQSRSWRQGQLFPPPVDTEAH